MTQVKGLSGEWKESLKFEQGQLLNFYEMDKIKLVHVKWHLQGKYVFLIIGRKEQIGMFSLEMPRIKRKNKCDQCEKK